jgi:transposase
LETAHNLLIDFLWSRGFCIYVIPPSVVSCDRDRHRSSQAHNDNSDALLIADLLRTDRHRFAPWKPDGQLVRRMKAKLSLIDSLTKTITAYSNRLQAVLLRYYPPGPGTVQPSQNSNLPSISDRLPYSRSGPEPDLL